MRIIFLMGLLVFLMHEARGAADPNNPEESGNKESRKRVVSSLPEDSSDNPNSLEKRSPPVVDNLPSQANNLGFDEWVKSVLVPCVKKNTQAKTALHDTPEFLRWAQNVADSMVREKPSQPLRNFALNRDDLLKMTHKICQNLSVVSPSAQDRSSPKRRDQQDEEDCSEEGGSDSWDPPSDFGEDGFY